MKNVRRLTATGLYDLDGVQTWLDDMAGRGLFLVKWGKYVCTFRRDNPDPNMRYHLEPVRAGERGRSGKRMAAMKRRLSEQGWNWVCTGEDQFHIFAAWDPFAPELETQVSAITHALKGLIKKNLLAGLFRLILLLLFGRLLIDRVALPLEMETMLTRWGPLTPVLLVLVPLAALVSFYPLYPILLTFSRLRGDRMLPRSRLVNRILIQTSYFAPFAVLVLCVIELTVAGSFQLQHRYMSPADLPVAVVQLADLEENSTFNLTEYSSSQDYAANPDQGTWALTQPSFWAPVHETVRQSGSLPGVWWKDLQPSYPSDGWYCPVLEIELWQTTGSMGSDYLYSNAVKSHPELNQATALSLDWATSCRLLHDNSSQLFVCRKGNRVLTVYYQGAKDLQSVMGRFKTLMTESWR